jgi:hypothetical protein
MESIISYVENGKRYPIHPRDDLFQQIPQLKKKFPDFQSYAAAELSALLGENFLNGTANYIEAQTFTSTLLINRGNKGFERIALPNMAQLSPIFGIEAGDFDGNGRMDIFLAGNFYHSEVITGQYDASYGLLMEFGDDGQLHVKGQLPWLSGDVRGLVPIYLRGEKGTFHIAAKNNQASEWIKLTGNLAEKEPLPEIPGAIKAILYFKNGKSRLKEFYFGSAYMSQQSNLIFPEEGLEKVVYFEKNGTPMEEYHF